MFTERDDTDKFESKTSEPYLNGKEVIQKTELLKNHPRPMIFMVFTLWLPMHDAICLSFYKT